MEKVKEQTLASEVIATLKKEHINFLNGVCCDVSYLVEDLENIQYLITDICDISEKEPENEMDCVLFSGNQGIIYAKSRIICDYNYRTRKTLNQLMERIRKYIREQQEGGGNV